MERLALHRPVAPPGLSWTAPGPLLAPPALGAGGPSGVATATLHLGHGLDGLQLDIAGPDRHRFRIVRTTRTLRSAVVEIQATALRSGPERAVLRAEAVAEGERLGCDLELQTAPFALAMPGAEVDEVLCVEARGSARFCADLARTLRGAGVNVGVARLKHPRRASRDYWVRDAFAPGAFVGAGTRAALRGIRGDAGALDSEPLDALCAEALESRGVQVLRVGAPRRNSGWIDWFGNVIASPPLGEGPAGAFPHGRLLIGRGRDRDFNPEVLAFFERQEVQWPPVFVDTSALYIGHVDELVNFVRGRDGQWRALMPSPELGLRILDDLAAVGALDRRLFQGPGLAHWWFGATVRHLATDVGLRLENRAHIPRFWDLQHQLSMELGLPRDRIIEVPALFHRGRSVWPNLVNGLALGDLYVAPDPLGPRVAGQDPIKAALTRALARVGVRAAFVRNFTPHHLSGGEVHCATNIIPRQA